MAVFLFVHTGIYIRGLEPGRYWKSVRKNTAEYTADFCPDINIPAFRFNKPNPVIFPYHMQSRKVIMTEKSGRAARGQYKALDTWKN